MHEALAFTDIETTGLDHDMHDIIELATIVVNPATLEPIATLDSKIEPTNIKAASPKALELNGYTPDAWRDAMTMREALWQFNRTVKGVCIVAYNVGFERRFLRAAYDRTDIEPLMHYRWYDVMSMAQPFTAYGLTSLKLHKVCEYFGIEPEPSVHRAMAGAKKCLSVYKAIRKRIGATP